MAEVVERVAKLEERFDGVTAGITEVRAELRALRTELRTEMQETSSAVRGEMQSGFSAVRVEFKNEVSELRAEMQMHFRWLMGGLGGVILAVLIAIATGAVGR